MDDPKPTLLCGAIFMILAGCAAPTQPRDDAPSAALEDLGPTPPAPSDAQSPQNSLAEAARRAADDLASGSLDRDPARVRTAPDSSPTGEQRPRQDQPPEPQTPQTPLPAHEQPQDASPAVEPAPGPDPIAHILKHLEAQADNPDRALAAAILARAVRAYADADDGTRPGQSLSPAERELATLLGPLLDALTTGDRADAPSRIARAIDDVSRDLPGVLPIRINDAALATDIHGFAAYTAFPTRAFLAGRVNRVLLYTEPADFQSRLASDPASVRAPSESAGPLSSHPGAYEVALGLELQLYNERGSMLAWRAPEERVSIRSDRPRSEVYLGTMIDLPASLSVGRYQLKVIVRDHSDGSEDQRVIPIEIVADPELTTRSTRTP